MQGMKAIWWGWKLVADLTLFTIYDSHFEVLVVPPARFQRATFRLGGGRSMQLSYGSKRATAYSKQKTAKKL